jgi:hypothetical protein
VLEYAIPLETFPLVEWHKAELADVPSFTVLKTQIWLTRPQCVNIAVYNCFILANFPSFGNKTKLTDGVKKVIMLTRDKHVWRFNRIYHSS